MQPAPVRLEMIDEPSPSPDTLFRQTQLALFEASVLKQAKWRALAATMGDEIPDRGLDLGADNGVISWLLRQRGGCWVSADLTFETVDAIQRMTGDEVHRLTGSKLPYSDAAFDLVVVVDLLEHVEDDRGLLADIGRCLRPGGRVILSLPRLNPRALLHPVRHAIGLTDAWHGHIHAGYDRSSLQALLPPDLRLAGMRPYTRFFSHLLDTLLNWRYARLHRGHVQSTAKGMVVTGDRIGPSSVRTLRRLYPFMRVFAALDALVPWTRGYMVVAELRKDSASTRA